MQILGFVISTDLVWINLGFVYQSRTCRGKQAAALQWRTL